MKTFTKESLEKLQKSIYLPDLIDDILHYQKSHLFFTHACPFHEPFHDKLNEYSLIITDNKYFCFECGASGDAIEFLMTYKKMTFVDAIETLAKKFGVKLEFTESSTKNKELLSIEEKTRRKEKADKLNKLLNSILED